MENTKRQIPIVIDTERNEPIWVESLSWIYEQHELQEIRQANIKHHRFVCQNCKQLVYLHAKRDDDSRHGHQYYFSHPEGIYCDWKSDSKSRAEIYAGVSEGNKHWQMKELLAKTLMNLPNWEVIDVDTQFVFSLDKLKRAKPDLHARYFGKDVAFEIQLRSESPKVILDRQHFYQEKEWPLIWLSAENEDQILDFFDKERIAVKQVQKDIAFCNRGNWFIFNAILASESLENKQLTILTKVWEPRLAGKKIYYDWCQYSVTYDQLTHHDGETFYRDFYALDRALKADLVEQGKLRVLANIDHFKNQEYRDWSQFLVAAKICWPTLDMSSDADWLHSVFKEDYSRRVLQVKSTVLTIIRYYSSDMPSSYKRWEQFALKLSHLYFGFHKNMSLSVLEKIMLILGYDLSTKLGRRQKSYARAVHNFFDYEAFKPYQALCLRAIELSEHKEELLHTPNVLTRLNDPMKKSIEINSSLDDFLEWFASAPIFEQRGL
ncbi:DUF6035 family protein [Shewanella baltica]|nr:DUF6035 family protein [Shewanella baltica]